MSDIQHIKDLMHDPDNARRHNPRNVGMLERSLNEVGAARSIVIDEDGVVLAGNATIDAAAQAGITRVRVVQADGNEIIAVQRSGLTSEQKTKLALYDNRVAELAEWEPDILAGIADSGLDLSGLFTADEWADVAMPTEQEAEEDAPVIVNEDEETRCQLGDVWRIGRHTVACADSTVRENVERLLDTAPDMVWADPPYGISAVDLNKGTLNSGNPYPFGGLKGSVGSGNWIPATQYSPVIGDDTTETAVKSARLLLEMYPKAKHFWWGGNHYTDALPPSSCWVVWDKRDDTTSNDFADGELAWSNQKLAIRIFRHLWSGLMKASERGERRSYPTQKPIALCAWAFEKYGGAGDLIFDPFLGSGPSLKAAEPLGRTVIGCELSPHYIDHLLEWGEAHGLECELITP